MGTFLLASSVFFQGELGLEIFSQIVAERKFGRVGLRLTLRNSFVIKTPRARHMIFDYVRALIPQ
jgi:hypothetical protein